MGDEITKGERTELRSLVKQQFKVLRKEVEQRQAELVAEAEEVVYGRFKGLDEERAILNEKLNEMTAEFNETVRRALGEHSERVGGIDSWSPARPPTAHTSPDRRVELRRAAVASIEADVRGALLGLERQETDLLRTLTIGALGSDAAHTFLGSIPTVGELVPAARLKELEASLADEELIGDPPPYRMGNEDFD